MRIIHITGARIVDGNGNPPYRGELLLQGKWIVAAGPRVEAPAKAEHIEAKGLYAAPGFIDAHSHLDLAPFREGGLELTLRQGITTAVVGQCGFSPAPMPQERQAGWQRYSIIAPPSSPASWRHFEDYIAALKRRGSPINVQPFVGHGTLRYAVKADDPSPATAAERRHMAALLEEAASQGARGLSLGLIYVPALFAGDREIAVLFAAAGRLGLPVSVHLRSESDELLQAITEMARLARTHGVRLHIAHLKCIGMRNRYKMKEALRIIASEGLSFDTYPYTYGSTSLLTLLPPALLRRKSTEQLLAELETTEMRGAVLPYLRGEVRPAPGESWDNLSRLVEWNGIELTDIPSEAYAELEGLSLTEAGRRLGLPPEEAALRILSCCGATVKIIDRYTDEETMLQALRHPDGVFSTDTLLGSRLHPRTAGAFPRIVQRYVFERGILTIEEAVAKMSSSTARIFNLHDRGRLEAGRRADVLLFSPTIRARSSPEQPTAEAQGVEWLFVGGEPVLRQGVLTGSRPGGVP